MLSWSVGSAVNRKTARDSEREKYDNSARNRALMLMDTEANGINQ